MNRIRVSRLEDLETIASWLRSENDCRLWSGARVAFPVDMDALARTIEYDDCESWSVVSGEEVVAFGQLVPKPQDRLHIARLIAAPERRREGLGRLLTSHLVEAARSRGPSAISLNVARDNESAIALYHSLGFVEAERPGDEPEAPSLYMQTLTGA